MKLIDNKVYLLIVNLVTVILSYSIYNYFDLTIFIPFLQPFKHQVNITAYTTILSFIRNYFEEILRSKSIKIDVKFSSHRDRDEMFEAKLNIQKYENTKIYLIVKILDNIESTSNLSLKIKFPPRITAQFEGKVVNENNELILSFKEFANSIGRYPLQIDILPDATSLSSQSLVEVELMGGNKLVELVKEDLVVNIE